MRSKHPHRSDANELDSPCIDEQIEQASLIDPYPRDKYEDVKAGRTTVDEFIDDLLRHVDSAIAHRRA